MTLPREVDPFDVEAVLAETGITTADALAKLADAINGILQQPNQHVVLPVYSTQSTLGNSTTGQLRRVSLPSSPANLRLAQYFVPLWDCEVVAVVPFTRLNGAPVGNFWFTVQRETASGSGIPDSVDRATTAHVDAASTLEAHFLPFDTAIAVAANQRFFIVMNGDYPISTANNRAWLDHTQFAGTYGENYYTFDGVAWQKTATVDEEFGCLVYLRAAIR